MSSNPGKILGMDPLTLGLVALGGYFLYQHFFASPASAGLWAGPSPAYEDYRAGERDTTLVDPLAAQREGERTDLVSLEGDQPEWYGVPI